MIHPELQERQYPEWGNAVKAITAVSLAVVNTSHQ